MRVLKFYNLQNQEVGSIPLDIVETETEIDLEPVNARIVNQEKEVEMLLARTDHMQIDLDKAVIEPPHDGKLYGMRNGRWEEVPGAPEVLTVKH